MDNDRLWRLIAKKRSGEASPEELEELESWRSAGSAEAEGYNEELMEKILDTPFLTLPELTLSSENWDNIEKAIAGEPAPASISFLQRYRWPVAAAGLLLLTSLALVLGLPDKDKKPGTNTSSSVAQMSHITTAAASTSEMELPDGTKVWLNGNSRLSYSGEGFGKTNRTVQLTGEAFFDVVKNADVPFIVHTASVNITVKGTAFNLKAYPAQQTVEAALVRGLIELSPVQDPERKILLKPNERIVLQKGASPDSVAAPEKNEAKLPMTYAISGLENNARLLSDTAWKCKTLQFDNETLGEVAAKLESWFSVSITFRNPAVKERRFTGVLEKETLQQTLRALQLSSYFEYELKNDQLYIGK